MPDMVRCLLSEGSGIESLRLTEISPPRPGPGEVLVAVHAAAVNPSDVAVVCGAMPISTFPRVPGRDFAGIVVAGPPELIDAQVWGTGGGDLGFSRDGSHAEYLVVPEAALVPKPASLSLVEAGASGVAYFVAMEALRRAGGVKPGATVLITGAVGGVGAAAACLARWKGARVVGAVRGPEEVKLAEADGIDVVVDTGQDDIAEAVRGVTAGRGADIAVDTVGGPVLEAVLAGLAVGGGACVIVSRPGHRIEVDACAFYQRDLRLTGLNSGRLQAHHAGDVLRGLLPGFSEGVLRAPRIAAQYPLADAVPAYRHVRDGAVGRVVILPQQ